MTGEGTGAGPGELPKRFTRKMLADYDGSVPGRPVLVAHDGRVYDVTGRTPWYGGRHWACARAGRDETGKMNPAVHGREMLARVPCVGVLADDPD